MTDSPDAYGAPVPSSAYSATDAFGYGWTKFTRKPAELLVPVLVLMVGLVAVYFVCYAVIGGLMLSSGGVSIDQETGVARVEPGSGFIATMVAFGLIGLVVAFLAQLYGAGLIKGSLESADGRPVSFSGMFEGWDKAQVLIASILVAVGVFIGSMLCYLPGLAFAYLTSYALYFVVDRRLRAVEAIKASISFTTSHLGETLLWFVLAAVAYLVGSALCGVGLLVAIPVILVGQAYTFRRLHGQPVAPA